MDKSMDWRMKGRECKGEGRWSLLRMVFRYKRKIRFLKELVMLVESDIDNVLMFKFRGN